MYPLVNPENTARCRSSKQGQQHLLSRYCNSDAPHSLSNGLCSLVEAEDRLTKSVIVQFNKNAEIQKVEFANTVIEAISA